MTAYRETPLMNIPITDPGALPGRVCVSGRGVYSQAVSTPPPPHLIHVKQYYIIISSIASGVLLPARFFCARTGIVFGRLLRCGLFVLRGCDGLVRAQDD